MQERFVIFFVEVACLEEKVRENKKCPFYKFLKGETKLHHLHICCACNYDFFFQFFPINVRLLTFTISTPEKSNVIWLYHIFFVNEDIICTHQPVNGLIDRTCIYPY